MRPGSCPCLEVAEILGDFTHQPPTDHINCLVEQCQVCAISLCGWKRGKDANISSHMSLYCWIFSKKWNYSWCPPLHPSKRHCSSVVGHLFPVWVHLGWAGVKVSRIKILDVGCHFSSLLTYPHGWCFLKHFLWERWFFFSSSRTVHIYT